MFGTKLVRSILTSAAVLGAATMAPLAEAGVPTVRVLDGIEKSAAEVYSGATAHTDMWTVGIHPEITALARSLKYDPALMYQYVRDNIETLPMFGMKKGALGALIDKKGTAFDQAALLVELMKAADQETPNDANFASTSFAPKFRFIRADVTKAEMTDWFGLSDRADVCNLLRAGGIPYSISSGGGLSTDCDALGAGTYDEAQILHVVVTATLDSGTAAFDPSYKKQAYLDGRSTLGSDMGFSLSDFKTAADFDTGATNGIDYVMFNPDSKDEQANIESELSGYASSLVTTLKTGDNYTLSTADVVGGVEIAPARDQAAIPTSWPALSGLPLYGTTLDAGGVSDMPDQYRTRYYLTHNSQQFDIFLDDVYGRRLWLDKVDEGGSDKLRLNVGDRVVWTTDYVDGQGLHIWVDNPYGGTAAENGNRTETFNLPSQFIHSKAALILSTGEVGAGLAGRLLDTQWQTLNADESLPEATLDSTSVEEMMGMGARFLLQQSHLKRLSAGASNSRHLMHNIVGVIMASSASASHMYLDFRSQVGVVAEGGDTVKRDAAIMTLTAAMSTLEGSMMDQLRNYSRDSSLFGYTAVLRLTEKLEQGQRLYDVPADSFSAIETSLSNYGPAVIPRLRRYNEELDHRLILAESGNYDQIGGRLHAGYVAIDDASGSVGHLVEVDTPTSTDADRVTRTTALKGAFSLPYDMPDGMEDVYWEMQSIGEVTTATMPSSGSASPSRTMLTTGTGGFPYALSYAPQYVVGTGWTHEFDIDASFSANGLIALGGRFPAEAAEAISALYATQAYLEDCLAAGNCGRAKQVALSSVAMTWLHKKLRDNVFTVRQGSNSTAYAKLADGTYYGPNGDGTTIAVTGTGPDTDAAATFLDGSEMLFSREAESFTDFELESWSFPYGVTLTFTRAEDGTITAENNLGRKLTINTDGRVTDDSGNQITYDADTGTFQLVGDATHTVVSYAFDDEGRITSISTPEVANKTVFTLNDLGHVIAQTQQNYGTTYIYRTDWRNETVNPASDSSVSIRDRHGRYSDVTDATGRTSRREFDRLGRVVKSYSPVWSADAYENATGDYAYTVTAFNKYHQRTVVTAYSKPKPDNSRESLTTTYGYFGADKYHQLASIEDADQEVTSLDYYGTSDANGKSRLKSVSSPHVNATDGGGTVYKRLTTTYSYNSLGQVQTVAAPDGTITETTYTAGLPTTVVADRDGLAITTGLTHTDEGDVRTFTNHRGTVTTFDYDDFRRRTLVQAPGMADSGYVYDGDGRPVKMRKCVAGSACASASDILLESERAYNGADRVIWARDPQGNQTSVAYNNAARFLDITAPNDVKIRKHFDAIGRTVTTVSAFGTSDSITEQMSYTVEGTLAWVEDGNDSRTDFEYDHWNRLIKTDYFGGNDEEVTAFDPLGRPTRMITRAGDTVDLTYDALGRVLTRAIAGGSSYSTKYDSMSQVVEVAHTAPDQSVQTVSYEYDALGRPTKETGAHGYYMETTYFDGDTQNAAYYDLSYNGSYSVRYTLDSFGRVDTIKEGGSTLVARYDYDTLSRVEALAFGNGAVQEFGYNADSGWLETLTLDMNADGDVEDEKEVRFTYHRDSFGRIEAEEVSNGAYVFEPTSAEATIAYISNPLNQYSSVDGVAQLYDDNGNLTFDGTFDYEWDQENRLTKVTRSQNNVTVDVAEYDYDALGRRSGKTVHSQGGTVTRYLWGGDTTYAELSASGTVQTLFVYGPGIDEPLMVKEGSTTRYVHRDGKNTVVAVSDTAASVTNIFTMDAWGRGADSAVSPYKFTSRRIDDETGNYYYRNRYYHANQGRFMSADPLGYVDGYNLYAYAGNDPVNFFDPLGLTIEEITVTAQRLDGNSGIDDFGFGDFYNGRDVVEDEYGEDPTVKKLLGNAVQDSLQKSVTHMMACAAISFDGSRGGLRDIAETLEKQWGIDAGALYRAFTNVFDRFQRRPGRVPRATVSRIDRLWGLGGSYIEVTGTKYSFVIGGEDNGAFSRDMGGLQAGASAYKGDALVHVYRSNRNYADGANSMEDVEIFMQQIQLYNNRSEISNVHLAAFSKDGTAFVIQPAGSNCATSN